MKIAEQRWEMVTSSFERRLYGMQGQASDIHIENFPWLFNPNSGFLGCQNYECERAAHYTSLPQVACRPETGYSVPNLTGETLTHCSLSATCASRSRPAQVLDPNIWPRSLYLLPRDYVVASRASLVLHLWQDMLVAQNTTADQMRRAAMPVCGEWRWRRCSARSSSNFIPLVPRIGTMQAY